VTRLWAGQLRIRDSLPGKQEWYSVLTRVSSWHWYPVTGALSLGLQWLECEIDYSHLSNAGIKSLWSYTSIPPYAFMVLCLIKHKNNFMMGARYCWRLPSGELVGKSHQCRMTCMVQVTVDEWNRTVELWNCVSQKHVLWIACVLFVQVLLHINFYDHCVCVCVCVCACVRAHAWGSAVMCGYTGVLISP
jgi:hypothetical protein